MDSDDFAVAVGNLDSAMKVEIDETSKEASEPAAHRSVSVDYENLMKLIEYADEMAKHIWHFCGVVPDGENEESLLLLYSYQNFRGSADADHGERKAPTLQEMSESEPPKQNNPEMSTDT